MPFITVEAGSLTEDQKVSLAKNLTKTGAEVMELPKDAFRQAVISLRSSRKKSIPPMT